MQALFSKEAVEHKVYPLDDRGIERTDAKLAGRPDLMEGRKSLTLYSGMKGMGENVFISLKNTSHRITAEVEIPPAGADGVIISQAGRFGGWSLYLKDGVPTYCYNYLGLENSKVSGTEPLQPGKTTLVFDFAYDGGGRGKGGTGTLLVNGVKVGEGRIAKTQPNIFSADETADVGVDDATPVSDDYKEHDNAFSGKISRVVVEVR